MKKFLAIIFIFSMLITSAAFAEDIGIMIIGGPETEAETVNLDDFKPGDVAKIGGYGDITLEDASWAADRRKYSSDTYYDDYFLNDWVNVSWYNSGNAAVFFCIDLNVLNTQKEPHNFCDDISDIVCTFDDGRDEYQFGGWHRQIFPITDDGQVLETLNDVPGGWGIHTYYRGEYCIVVTLPIDVYSQITEEDKSMTVSFKMADNEFTYIYRK